jgi:two-component system sensor histidine kinase/response regulator
MSRVESGRTDVINQTFDLDEVLSDLYHMFQNQARIKNLQWEIVTAATLPELMVADQGKIRQILTNLIGNAMKYTDHGGVILRVRAERHQNEQRLRFIVEDTGPGISEQEQGGLFEAFQRGSSGDNKGGSGLGLAISRRFAHLMGGDITVSSQVGAGSSFAFVMPFQEGDAADCLPPTLSRRVLGLKPEQGGMRILLVDDKADNRLFLRRLLEPIGFDLREAVDGLEAVSGWRTWAPHLILMDIVMPKMDGHEATRRIREHPEGGDVKIVALSASAFEEDRAAVLATGADDFIRKPVTMDSLLETIKRHLCIDYEYADDPPRMKPSQRLIPAVLRPEQLSRLPESLRKAMARAAFESNDQKMNDLINLVPPECQDLADTLRVLVGRFEWNVLEPWLKDSHDDF